MLKKSLVWLLTVCMVLSIVPVSAFASDGTDSGVVIINDTGDTTEQTAGGTATDGENVAGIGDVYYTPLAEAVDAASAENTTVAYTSASYIGGVPAIFGEAEDVVAAESFVVKLYSGETLVGTATLVDTDKVLLNGVSKAITWHAALANDGDSWWSTEWVGGALKADAIPDKVEIWADGAKVSEGAVQLNINDLEKPIIAAIADADGNVQSFVAGTGYLNGVGENAPVYDEALKTALAAAQTGETVTLLRDLEFDELHDYKIPAGVTLDGNDHKITIGNVGNYSTNAAFYSDGSYTVKNLTIELTAATSTAKAFDMANGGSLENVTVLGSFCYGVYADSNVSAVNCEFANAEWGIYSESTTAKLTVTDCTFDSLRAATLRSDDTFTGNVVNGDKGLSVATANADISGNTFTGDRAMSISAEGATISGNVIGADSTVEFSANADLSGNYWGGNAPSDSQLVAEGTVTATVDSYYTTNDNGNLGGVVKFAKGSITPVYTRETGFWGEGGGNATESLVVELYEGENKIASATLNNINGIIDGDVYVTWSIPFAGSTDEYWTVEWAEGYPKYDMAPTKGVMVIDGTAVATGAVQFNAPDNLNKIVAIAEGFTGGVVAYTTLTAAMGNFNGRKVNVLRDVTESIEGFYGATLTTNVEGGVTITSTYDNWIYATDVFVGSGVTVVGGGVFFDGGESTIEGTVKITDTHYHGYDAKVTIQNGGQMTVDGAAHIRYNGTADAGLYVYGDGNDETVELDIAYYLGAYSGTVYAEDANIEVGYMLLNGETDGSDYAAVELELNNSTLETTGTSDGQKQFNTNGDATISLTNGSSVKVLGDFNAADTVTIEMDETSSIASSNLAYVATYDELVAALEAGKDVVLTADITCEGEINGTDANVDLNGNKLTLTVGGTNFFGNSTVENGTIDITGCVASGDCIIGIGDYSNDATLNLNNVNITGDGYSSAYAVLYVYGSSTLNINGGSIVVSNDSASAGGVIKAHSAANGKINITGTESDPVELTFTDAMIGILDGTVVMNYVDLDITGGANAINQSALTVKNSTLTIKDCDGRALTLSQGDVVIENSTLDFSGATEGEIRFKKAVTLTADDASTIKECEIYADDGAAGANVNGVAVEGTETAMHFVKVADGKTTIEDPTAVVEVDTAAELAEALAANRNVKLTANITITDWTTVASYSRTLDGNNMTISGLNAPLFDTITDVTIKDLTIEANIATTASDAAAIALLTGGTTNITNVTVKGTISGGTSANNELSFNGGAAGFIVRAAGNLTIDNCVNEASVTGVDRKAAGFVSSNGTAASGDVITIKDSENKGTIIANHDNCTGASGEVYAAGFIAWNGAKGITVTLENCINSGNISGVRTIDGYSSIAVGGIIGTCWNGAGITTTLTDVVNTGNVTATNNGTEHNAYAAGIIGLTNPSSNTVVESATVSGTITATIGSANTVGRAAVGGITAQTNNNKSVLTVNSADLSAATYVAEGGAARYKGAIVAYHGGDDTSLTYTEENLVLPIGVKLIGNAEGLAGEGTETDPYLISNLEELIWFRDSVNTYTSDGSNQYKGKYVKLTDDIDLSGINWTPIGTNSNGDHMAFLGTFDGDGHTISNLYVNADGDHLGFFARVGSYGEDVTPTVKNIIFENVDVSSNTTTGHGGSYVAGVIANAGGNSVVSGITVTGDVYVTGYGYVGGIVGHGYPDIDNCHVKANDGSWVQAYYWCAGGIIGYAGEGGTPITNSSVSGIDIWSAYGAAAAVAGLLQDGNKLENVSASDVSITSASDYCMGYIAGNGEESTMTDITVNNVTATANGKEITSTDAVAKIGSAIYFDLQSAINAAQDGDTVTLLADVALSATVGVNIEGAITIDGNGHTITNNGATNAAIMLGSSGYGNDSYKATREVTLKNVVFDGWTTDHVVRVQGVTATIEGCTFTNCGQTKGLGLLTLTFADATVSNCVFENNKCIEVIDVNSWGDNSNASVSIENCSFKNNEVSGLYGLTGVIAAFYGEVTIENNEFVGNTAANIVYTETNATVSDNYFAENTLTGDSANKAVIIASPWKEGTYNVAINGNAFVGDAYVGVHVEDWTEQYSATTSYDLNGNYWNGGKPSYSVTGTPAVTLDNYCTAYEYTADGLILSGTETMVYAAEISGIKYESLADAFAAAKMGDTITLLADITLTEGVSIMDSSVLSDITLDGNGKTITLDMNGAGTGIRFGGEWATGVKIMDLTITGSAKYALWLNGGTSSVLTNVTVTGDYDDFYGAVIFYGTHGATLDNCRIVSGFTNGQAAYPLNLTNGTVITELVANDGADMNPKIFIDSTSSITTLYADTHTAMLDVNSVDRVGTILDSNTEQPMVASIDGVLFATFEAAFAAANEGDTVMILAGEYTGDVSVNKAITVVGETDADGNNLVTINGKLSVTGTGVTVKNLNVNNASERAMYVSGGDILIEGCNLSGVHGLRYCYANNGDVTLKDCVITGSTYGVHFDGGSGEGDVIIDGCTITGWTSFGSAIEGVTITDTTFEDGNYNLIRFYQNATITDCTFPSGDYADYAGDGMRIDVGSGGAGMEGVTIAFEGCQTADGSDLIGAITPQVASKSDVTIDSVQLITEASVTDTEGDTEYYWTLAEAFKAAKDGDTVTLLADVADIGHVNLAANITVEGNGHTISGKSALHLAASGATVNNVVFKDIADPSDTKLTPIYATDWDDGATYTITNCVFDNVEYEAMQIADTDETVNNVNLVITGNEFKNSATAYRYVHVQLNSTTGGVADMTIKNNKFYTDGKVAAALGLYYVDGTSDIDIAYNYIDNPNSVSIMLKDANDESYNDAAIVLPLVDENGDELKLEALVVKSNLWEISFCATLADAIKAAKDGDTIKLIDSVTLTESLVLNTEGTITIDGNGYTITTADGFNDTQVAAIMLGATTWGDAETATHNYTFKNVVFDGVTATSVIRAQGVTLTVDGCEVKNTAGSRDMVLRLDYTEATIKNSTFDGNVGGGMVVVHNYNVGDEGSTTKLTIDKCVFSDNEVNLNSAVVYYVVGGGCTITNTEFSGNTINSAVNAATLYLGFQEDCTVTGCLFKDNTVHTTKDTLRVAGAIFFGYEAEITGNAFVNNKATNAAGDALGQHICTSTYYDCTIDLSGNYFDGERPVEGEDYFIQHKGAEYEGEFDLLDYCKTYEIDAETGAVVLSEAVKVPHGDIMYFAYVPAATGTPGTDSYRESIKVDIEKVYAEKSLVVELYSNGELLSVTTLRESDRDDATAMLYPFEGTVTANIVLNGKLAGSWDTEWKTEPSVANLPDTIKVYADGELVDELTGKLSESYVDTYNAFEGVAKQAIVIDGEGNKTYYASLVDALNAVNAEGGVKGQTLVLSDDVDLSGTYLVAANDTVIDLNGHTLTAAGLADFGAGSIVDNGETKGLLAVPQGMLMMTKSTYPMLPVWNEAGTGYIFVAITMQSVLDVKGSDSFDFRFRPSLDNDYDTNYAILGDGALDNELTINVTLEAMSGGTLVETIGFTFSEETIAAVYQSPEGDVSALKLLVSGVSDAFDEIVIKVSIESESGLIYEVEAQTFTPTTAE